MRLERTIKTLLTIVKNNEKFMSGCGLCYLVSVLYHDEIITYDERKRLEDYLYKNRPKKGKYIFWRPNVGSPYWWKPGAWTPRKWWLNAQIRKWK